MEITSLFLALCVLVSIILLVASFKKRSFSPVQGERYMLTFFGLHLFEIRVGDKSAHWYQKLPFYLICWPFNVASFNYEWVQEMPYSEYLKKLKIAETKTDYDVSVAWEPEYHQKEYNPDGTTKRESEIDENGIPIDRTTRVLVSRKEKMISLRKNEGYAVAAEFETSDGFRGWRIFTLFFEIQDLSKVISEIRQWQKPANLTFIGEYNKWSKTVTYKELRETSLNDLILKLGKKQDESFIDEINEQISRFGYKVNLITEGQVYVSIETQDMLESQELPKKALDKQNAAKIEAETVRIKAAGESDALKRIEDTKTKIQENRVAIEVNAAKELSKFTVEQLTAKFGKKGIGGMTGVFVEGSGNSDIQTFNTEKLVENILSLTIAKNQGGVS